MKFLLKITLFLIGLLLTINLHTYGKKSTTNVKLFEFDKKSYIVYGFHFNLLFI